MMERKIKWSLLYIALSFITLLNLLAFSQGERPKHLIFNLALSSGFVTRSGTQLILNGHPFRFAGANMHWLPFDDSTNYTSQFRINDGLNAAKEMGLTVIRSHDLGISTGCSNCIEPTLGVFN